MKKALIDFNNEELSALYRLLSSRYDSFRAQNLKLNMARGKPSPEQLDLSEDVLNAVTDINNCYSRDGIDCRNYSDFYGLSELRELFSQILSVPFNNVLIGGNSSLTLMYDTISRAFLHGLANSPRPWSQEEKIKMLCPVPGYDRHYTICESFGIEMISIPLTGSGPDMDMVEELVAKDPLIKGIWIIPVYSNPTGDIYSNEVLFRLANMPAKANDFTIICDNAYPFHTLTGSFVKPICLFDMCCAAGNEDRPIFFASTSKISFAAGGVSCIAMSDSNFKKALPSLQAQFICMDKLNQLRHARVFSDLDAVKSRMLQHCELLSPKFDLVEKALDANLSSYGVASWNLPLGGYFISLKVMENTAKRIIGLCKDAGLILTSAGAGFPYSIDPHDCYIRLAPSYPSLEELNTATELLCISILLASIENILSFSD
ncbi:MAG: aminotransferase class I/II-fold pyridoxal phosphate-dependent enzyme [Oscillospiraceae bacterium]|nr:aminotransferase class I/II-fold pyridoxal phosphate-dependent enzyme [Oscillospiraceae bacterium]